MESIRIATAQFENRDADKACNLARMEALTAQATAQGAQVVCFHEVCIPGYSWLQPLSLEEMRDIAEPVPDGPSVQALIDLARRHGVVVMAGLLERDDAGRVFNAYVAVSGEGMLGRHRKLHTFINPHLTPGDSYCVFDMLGWKVGVLICYDNNLPENARITALMGAQVIVAPHVTGCLPSAMPGRGVVDRKLWDARATDPVPLRLEFDGPKGRGWLMRWLPARAWENGVYYVFSNPIGWDYDTVKPGLAMVLDPHGEMLAESRRLGDDVVVALLTPERLDQASGRRYRMARRPELYGRLTEPQKSVTLPGWMPPGAVGRGE